MKRQQIRTRPLGKCLKLFPLQGLSQSITPKKNRQLYSFLAGWEFKGNLQ